MNHSLLFLAMGKCVELWFSKVQIKIRFTLVRIRKKVGITSEVVLAQKMATKAVY